MGKAGEANSSDSAKFIVFCHAPRKNYYKKFLTEPLPIESHLDIDSSYSHANLHDHLNSEIINQTIKSKPDAIDWITWTFYYRRLTKNPNYYNL